LVDSALGKKNRKIERGHTQSRKTTHTAVRAALLFFGGGVALPASSRMPDILYDAGKAPLPRSFFLEKNTSRTRASVPSYELQVDSYI
jgi:hypothetical protein